MVFRISHRLKTRSLTPMSTLDMNRHLPYLDGVEIVYIGEASTLSAAFQSKDVDLIYSGNHDGSMDLMRVMAPQIESGDVVVETNTSGQLLVMNGLIPNSADPDSPWADARVRRACVLFED